MISPSTEGSSVRTSGRVPCCCSSSPSSAPCRGASRNFSPVFHLLSARLRLFRYSVLDPTPRSCRTIDARGVSRGDPLAGVLPSRRRSSSTSDVRTKLEVACGLLLGDGGSCGPTLGRALPPSPGRQGSLDRRSAMGSLALGNAIGAAASWGRRQSINANRRVLVDPDNGKRSGGDIAATSTSPRWSSPFFSSAFCSRCTTGYASTLPRSSATRTNCWARTFANSNSGCHPPCRAASTTTFSPRCDSKGTFRISTSFGTRSTLSTQRDTRTNPSPAC